MEIFINILNDLVIICGNIIIFSIMLNFREQKLVNKIIILSICALLMVAYTLCVYLADIPVIHATLMCFTLPSLILFWSFSKIKDSRFFLTFCFVDTISLIIGFITKYLAILFPNVAIYITFFVNIVLYVCIIIFGYKFFNRYSQLMKFEKAGWRSMMIASFIIYFALYFLAAYPTPIKERPEYAPCYIVFCCVILSCYVVFWDSIVKTKKLHDQYMELEKSKIYHKIAYTDTLTGLFNRFYYVEKINEIERDKNKYNNICSIVIDINNFKDINDMLGHHTGDIIIKDTAEAISRTFNGNNNYIFRPGGDEFYILMLNANEEDLLNKLSELNNILASNNNLENKILSVASGYSFIYTAENADTMTIEQNFVIADKKMYENKNKYKIEHNNISENCNCITE